MKKLLSFFPLACFAVLILAGPGRTETAGSIEERFKASINAMVLKVQKTDNPSEKRAIIGRFLLRMDRGMAMVEVFKTVSNPDQTGIASLREKIRSQYDELNGLNGRDRVANADLNSYASYLRQDMEQADTYWTGNGIYISVGTLILILILILILR